MPNQTTLCSTKLNCAKLRSTSVNFTPPRSALLGCNLCSAILRLTKLSLTPLYLTSLDFVGI